MHVFIRDTFCKIVSVVRICLEVRDCVLLLKFYLISNSKDLIIYFVYVLPEGSSIYDNSEEHNGVLLFHNNVDNIMISHPDAMILLVGDLNA